MIIFMLTVMMFYPSGKYEVEHRPVEVKACDTISVDSSCGIGACMKLGRARAAEIWGIIPGMNFGIMCTSPTGEEAKEGTGAGGGHPALGFHGSTISTEH